MKTDGERERGSGEKTYVAGSPPGVRQGEESV